MCGKTDRSQEHEISHRAAKRRLRWLCQDMIARLETAAEHDDELMREIEGRSFQLEMHSQLGCGFGNIDPRIDEAAPLAVLLGFSSPPIHRLLVDKAFACTFVPLVGETGPFLCPPRYRSMDWDEEGTSHAWYYRVHDPAGGFIDVLKGFIKSGEGPPDLAGTPLWDRAMRFRRPAIPKVLRRWIAAIDGLPESPPEPPQAVPAMRHAAGCDGNSEPPQVAVTGSGAVTRGSAANGTDGPEVPPRRRGPLRLQHKEAHKRVKLLREWAEVQEKNKRKPRRDRVKKLAFLRGKTETLPDMKAYQTWYRTHCDTGEFPRDPRELKDETLRRLFPPQRKVFPEQ